MNHTICESSLLILIFINNYKSRAIVWSVSVGCSVITMPWQSRPSLAVYVKVPHPYFLWLKRRYSSAGFSLTIHWSQSDSTEHHKNVLFEYCNEQISLIMPKKKPNQTTRWVLYTYMYCRYIYCYSEQLRLKSIRPAVWIYIVRHVRSWPGMDKLNFIEHNIAEWCYWSCINGLIQKSHTDSYSYLETWIRL